MNKKNYLLLIALCCAWLCLPITTNGQVKIGEGTQPEKGAVLDLKKTTAEGYLGGVLLSHVNITDLGYIPEDYTGVGAAPLTPVVAGKGVDTYLPLEGMVVYNTNIMTGAGVYVWNGEEWKLISLTGKLSVTPDQITLPYTASHNNTVTVNCKNGNGDDIPSAAWTLTVPAGCDWLTLSLNSDGSNASKNLSGTGTQTVYLVAVANPLTSNRTTTIDMGGATVVNVTQIFDPPGGGTQPADIVSYVGAYWRASQKGERVIKIDMGTNADNLGDWTASVIWKDGQWGSDGIILANGGSADPAIYTSTPGNAENYPVAGNATTITGTVASGGSVLFRIGLTNAWSSYNENTAPARYAVVLLSYNNNTKHQKIYLRQGEGAEELVASSNIKWTPYNLMLASGIQTTGYIELSASGANAAAFVDFPTLSGYYLKWNSLWALSSNTTVNNDGTQYPLPWKNNQDPCALIGSGSPSPFVSPEGGSNRSDWGLSPLVVFGGYADGCFDRRFSSIDNSSPDNFAIGNMVASPGFVQVGDFSKSIFFPASGGMNGASALKYWPDEALYWGRSTRIIAHYYNWSTKVGVEHYKSEPTYAAFTVRCVRR